MERIFITQILPERYILQYKLSIAACNFSLNLINGGCFNKVYSILGSNVGGKIDDDAYNDSRFELIYYTFLRVRGRTAKILASFVEQWKIFRLIPLNSSVWFYNATTINFILYFLLRLFKRSVQINIIQLDFTPSKKIISKSQLSLYVINNSHGNIRLSNWPLFTNLNSIILPGVVPITKETYPRIEHLNNSFLLSGALYENIAQTSMVLDAFSTLSNCELHITGVIDDESKLKDYSSQFHNIIWHGQVSYKEYLNILHSCTFLLSTRDENYPENQCNFPSKIIEALLHNRVVISTIEYQQISGILYYRVNSEKNSFIKRIIELLNMSDSDILKYANQGLQIERLYNTEVWKNSMEQIEAK